MRSLLLATLSLVAFHHVAYAEISMAKARVWKASNGRQVSARLVNTSGSSITLEVVNGGETRVDLDLLSKADRKLVEAIRNSQDLQLLRSVRGIGDVMVDIKDGNAVVTALKIQADSQPATNFKALGNLQHLRRVSIVAQPNAIAVLTHLRRAPKLDQLTVFTNTPMGATSLSIDEMKLIGECKRLTTITARITNEGAQHLSQMKQLKRLHLNTSRITSEAIEQLAKLEKLNEISLMHTRITDDSLRHIGKLKQLTHLNVHYTRISDDALNYLSSLERLQELWLPSQITSEGLQYLRPIRSLRHIVRSANWSHDDGELAFLHRMPIEFLLVQGGEFSKLGLKNLAKYTGLKALRLYSRDIKDSALAHVANLKQLERLNASINLEGAGLSHLANLTNLRELRLMSYRFFHDRHLIHLIGLEKLEELELTCVGRGGQPYGPGLEHIKTLPKLRRLIVPGDYLATEGWQAISEMSQLRALAVGGKITDEEFKSIAKLTGLQELRIMTNRITDASSSELKKLRELRLLDLSGARMTDQGFQALAELKNLEELHLAMCDITDASLDVLKGLPKLMKLNIAGARISSTGRRQLQRKLPFLQFRQGGTPQLR